MELEAKHTEVAAVSGFSIAVFKSISEAEPDWLGLEPHSFLTYYQSFAWCKNWFETIGKNLKIQPIIVIGKSSDGLAQFLLPFQIRRRFGLDVLEWLTQPENNYGHGIFNHSISDREWCDWFKKNIYQILTLLPRFDVIAFGNMPNFLFGYQNPLATLNRFKSANHSFVTKLASDFDSLQESKRSLRSISKMRRRDERLAEAGELTIEVSSFGAVAANAIAQSLANKSSQLEEIGVRDFPTESLSAFFSALVAKESQNLQGLYVFRLAQAGKTISSLIGGIYSKTFWLMILSMPADAPRQFSPGDYILRKSIAWSCEHGLTHYDFSNGHSNYKELWADNEVELFDYFAAKTFKGLPLAAILLAAATLKRIIKNQPQLKSFFFSARQILKGTRR